MKYVIIPDSFKGTLSALQVSSTIAKAIKRKDPRAQIREIPMADGGEGTCHCFKFAMGGEFVELSAKGPYGELRPTYYWRKGNTAVVEMATICGFQPDGKRDPSAASTFGVGQIIRHAIDAGCNEIVLGLGGSCSNDGGAGMVSALGGVFFDASGREFIPVGADLDSIANFDGSALSALLEGVNIRAMCDVTNPLHGRTGAAYVFAPQKGADGAMVEMLDKNLRHYDEFMKRRLGLDVGRLPSSGAAGGMGAGAVAFLGAQLVPGAKVVLDMVDFDTLLVDCDAVITGEGSLDSQSLGGKVVSTVASHAKSANVPVIAVVGRSTVDAGELLDLGISKVIQSIDHCSDPASYEKTAEEDLLKAVEAEL